MNEFLEECRREWKRLRVPDAVAEEMATDLEADLREAEAEGVSAADVLGSGTADARSFAAAWAIERGVIPSPRRGRLFDRPLKLAGVLAVVAVAVVGAALAVFAAPEPDALQGLPRVFEVNPASEAPNLPEAVTVTPDGIWITAAAGQPATWNAIRIKLPPPPSAIAGDSGVDAHTIGSILLGVGLAGIVVVMMLLYASSAAGSDRGRRYLT